MTHANTDAVQTAIFIIELMMRKKTVSRKKEIERRLYELEKAGPLVPELVQARAIWSKVPMNETASKDAPLAPASKQKKSKPSKAVLKAAGSSPFGCLACYPARTRSSPAGQVARHSAANDRSPSQREAGFSFFCYSLGVIREKIEQAVKDALKSLGAEAAFVVERPRALAHGDYATNAALVAKIDARALADKLNIEGIEKIEVVGKFVNFFLSREELMPKEQKIPQLYAGKLALVEYTSPNLFKPLHIGNLISTILGESIARLYEYTGAEVKRINYPSDIGPTIAKGVWGLQKLKLDPSDIQNLGKAYVAGNDAFENDENAKAQIDEINTALYEDSNPEWSELRRRGIKTSLKSLDVLCARLDTAFDKIFFESEAAPIGKKTVLAHIEDGIFQQSDGAVVYRGEQDGLHTRVFLNSKGLPTYEAKDLGLFELKREAYPDFDITVTDTGPEQAEYFKVLYAAIRRLHPDAAGKALLHSAHGMLKLTTGKMSSRKGNVVTGESLLADLIEAAKEKMQGRELVDADKTAEQIAVGAIKYAVLKQGSGRDIIFDPEKSLSLEGDSGPYLQYARVRALSLLKKNPSPDRVLPFASDQPSPIPLARILIHYPEVVERAAKEMESHYLATYLTELASAFNTWYGTEHLIIEGKILPIHLKLVEVFEKTMSQGLQALGIPAPEEM